MTRSKSPNSTAATKSPTHYRAADRFGPSLLVYLPLVGIPGSIVLGSIYAFLAGLFHEVESPAWMIIVTPMYAAGLALLAKGICRLGNVRGRRMSLYVSLFVGLLGLYIAWIIYLKLLTGGKIFDLQTWIISPVQVARAMKELASYRGVSSWFCWFLELLTVLGFIVYLTRSDAELPFCEKCGHWADEIFRLTYADSPSNAVAELFTQSPVEAVRTLGEKEPGAMQYIVVRVHRCPCNASRYASMDRMTVKAGKSASMKYRAFVPGKRELYFDPGSPRSTDAKSLVANLEIDDAIVAKFEEVRSKQNS